MITTRTRGTFLHPVRMSQGTATGSSSRTDAGRDAIKSGGTPVVAMHFDAVIIRRVTYASLPIFPPLSFHADRRLSGIFKCILRRGSPHHRRDFFSRMRRWEERKEEGFPRRHSAIARGVAEGQCLREAFDSGTNVFHRWEIPGESYFMNLIHRFYLANRMRIQRGWVQQNRLELTLINLDGEYGM